MIPPVKRKREHLDFNSLSKAISTAKSALQFFTVGVPIIRRGPKGEVHVDVPVMYTDFAIDKIHYDPRSKIPSPKGRPVRVYSDVNSQEIREIVEGILKESYIIEAAEFREPDDAWVIPVAWNKLIIMYVRVSHDGEELIPDYGLTKEVRRHVN
ncbi:MAG: hypothetical protein J7K36_04070 [Archaeoglobaceae archaeon]|nr:hypothetical protein [Archaeoglobaceae archaeon]